MTTMTNQTSVIDDAAFSVRRTIHIGAPLAKVWSAVTEPTLISRWFGQADFDGSAAGAQGTLSWDDYGSIPVRIEAVDAPRSITYRWSNDDALGKLPAEVDDRNSTVFTFTLEPDAGGTRLSVVETGFENTSDPSANLESHRGGWDSELDELVDLLESAA
jgi:uncharacterized protein YndB with AHSA1/START domain